MSEKAQKEYKVWIQDTDGSERLGCTVCAKSVGHARVLAKARGLKKITAVEEQTTTTGQK